MCCVRVREVWQSWHMFAPHDHMIIQFCTLLSIIIPVAINQQLSAEITIHSSMSCFCRYSRWKKKHFFLDCTKKSESDCTNFNLFYSFPDRFYWLQADKERGVTEGAILTVTVALIASIQTQYFQGFFENIFSLPILISSAMRQGLCR